MLTKSLTTLLFPLLALTSPAPLTARADENCTPQSYTLSDYVLVTSPNYAYLDFNFKSNFADKSGIVDAVTNGVNCGADGTTIPNNNACRTPDRKLLFDLRAPQQQAGYQITHTWTCNGSTWMSGTPVTIDPLNCTNDGTTRYCKAGTLTIIPRNVRKICSSPTNC